MIVYFYGLNNYARFLKFYVNYPAGLPYTTPDIVLILSGDLEFIPKRCSCTSYY